MRDSQLESQGTYATSETKLQRSLEFLRMSQGHRQLHIRL